MRYLVRVNELKEKTDYIIDKIRIIEENIEELNRIKSTIIWEGKASTAFINNYDNYLVELKNIRDRLVLLVRYLTSYYNNYGITYMQLREKYGFGNKEV